jgi:hypothetical protein
MEYADHELPLDINDLKESTQTIQQQDYGMRMFAGSESLLRELKLSTPREHRLSRPIMDQSDSKRLLTSHHSQSSLIHLDHYTQLPQPVIPNQHTTQTHTSQSSLFERHSFQQFTASKLQGLTQNNEFLHLISMREQALDYRQDRERRYIKKMYKSRQFSPRTYSLKKGELERWVHLEIDEITKSKRQFQEEWDRTVQMIEETQRNVETMREQIRVGAPNVA